MGGRKYNERDDNGEKAPGASQLRPSLHPTYARLLAAELRRRGFPDDDIFEGTRLSSMQLLEEERVVLLPRDRHAALRSAKRR